MNYRRLLQLAEIGAKRELEKALIDFELLRNKSETIPIDIDFYENALASKNKAFDEYKELCQLIEALQSF